MSTKQDEALVKRRNDGSTFEVTPKATDKVEDIKRQIAQERGIPTDKQVLVLGGRPLDAQKPASAFTGETTLFLLVRP